MYWSLNLTMGSLEATLPPLSPLYSMHLGIYILLCKTKVVELKMASQEL